MSDVGKAFKYAQSGKKWSLILLILVIVLTVWFSVYDHILTKDIKKIRADINEHKARIEKLEAQDNVYIYSLIKRHKKILNELEEKSRITKYIDHLDKMLKHYDYQMRGFQMWGGQITTKVTFENNEKGLAYKKASRFISEYRSDPTALLDLEKISIISSMDQDVKFPVLFTLKK